jgi:hypothetical protein
MQRASGKIVSKKKKKKKKTYAEVVSFFRIET